MSGSKIPHVAVHSFADGSTFPKFAELIFEDTELRLLNEYYTVDIDAKKQEIIKDDTDTRSFLCKDNGSKF